LGGWRVADSWSIAVERTSSIGWVAQLQLRRGLPARSQEVRGDAAALAEVYERHHQALYRYCRSILRDDEDARDALQSTMAKALAALRDEQRDFELRPWLFRIAHNEAISRLRRRREIADTDAVAEASTDSLAQTVEDRERLAHLRTDLQDLPERQRAALVLRELSGLSHEEIAGVLDTSARSVKQTIFEARVALQECAEGRAMVCADVQRALSDGDGRILRGRRMRAHVRSCRSCRQFKAALAQRPADLAVLAPALPAAAGAALLGHLLPAAKAGLTSGAGTATGVGGGLAGTVATKAAIVVAATATLAGTTTAVRSVVEPSRPAPPAAAPATHPRAVPASASPSSGATGASTAHRRAPARAHRSASGHTTSKSAPASHAAGTASKAKGRRAHDVPPGRAKVTGSAGPGKSQAAHARPKPEKPLKPVKAAKPAKAPKPAKTQPPHPVHPSTAGQPSLGPAATPGAATAPQATAGAGNGAAAGEQHANANSP
jgi:RNA polymerase sigma factor (sigma-70 family)